MKFGNLNFLERSGPLQACNGTILSFTNCTGGWVGPRAGLKVCGKSRPTGIRSPDLPALSKSLYRPSYRRPQQTIMQEPHDNNCIRTREAGKFTRTCRIANFVYPPVIILPVCQHRACAFKSHFYSLFHHLLPKKLNFTSIYIYIFLPVPVAARSKE